VATTGFLRVMFSHSRRITAVHYTLYTIHLTLYTILSKDYCRTLYTIHLTLYTIHLTLYTILSKDYCRTALFGENTDDQFGEGVVKITYDASHLGSGYGRMRLRGSHSRKSFASFEQMARNLHLMADVKAGAATDRMLPLDTVLPLDILLPLDITLLHRFSSHPIRSSLHPIRSGVPRGAYRGIVPFRIDGWLVLLTPDGGPLPRFAAKGGHGGAGAAGGAVIRKTKLRPALAKALSQAKVGVRSIGGLECVRSSSDLHQGGLECATSHYISYLTLYLIPYIISHTSHYTLYLR
jgi:hypothetical protein